MYNNMVDCQQILNSASVVSGSVNVYWLYCTRLLFVLPAKIVGHSESHQLEWRHTFDRTIVDQNWQQNWAQQHLLCFLCVNVHHILSRPFNRLTCRQLHLTGWWVSNSFTECYIIHEFESAEHCLQVSIKKTYGPNHVTCGIPPMRVVYWDTADRSWLAVGGLIETNASNVSYTGQRLVQPFLIAPLNGQHDQLLCYSQRITLWRTCDRPEPGATYKPQLVHASLNGLDVHRPVMWLLI